MTKRKLTLAFAAALTVTAAASARAADVGVSVTVGQPGFYGQIDVGTMRPQVIYAQPMVIQKGQGVGAPIYMRVPPGHEKHWDKHCNKYNACGRPVYFVRDSWYEQEYVPHYQERHGQGKGGQGSQRNSGKGNQGKGKGHGKDQG
jgi:hypothetical protein